MHPITSTAPSQPIRALRFPAGRDGFDDPHQLRFSEVGAIMRQHDLDDLAGERAVDEHHSPVVESRQRPTTRHESLCMQQHIPSVGPPLSPADDAVRDTGTMSGPSDDDERWYWDLSHGRAVRASERGPGAQTMGPYESRAEAERWQERVDERNEAWADADDEWDTDQRDESET